LVWLEKNFRLQVHEKSESSEKRGERVLKFRRKIKTRLHGRNPLSGKKTAAHGTTSKRLTRGGDKNTAREWGWSPS